MRKKHSLPMRRIVSISDAISMVEGVDTLDSKTSYWLSRIKEKLQPVIKPYITERDKILNEASKKADGMPMKEITALSEETQKKVEELLDMQAEEVDFPVFKRDQFEAKEDINRATKDGIITFRRGQSLVPIKFLTMMGDLIEDDEIKM